MWGDGGDLGSQFPPKWEEPGRVFPEVPPDSGKAGMNERFGTESGKNPEGRSWLLSPCWILGNFRAPLVIFQNSERLGDFCWVWGVFF